MIFNSNTIYARVWKVDKKEKYIDLQVSTSEKNQEGEYEYSTWFPRVIGHAFNSLKDVKKDDRIRITKSKFTNLVVKDENGNKKPRFRFIVLEAEIENPSGNSQKQAPDETQTPPAQQTAAANTSKEEDDTCPW